MPKKVNLRQTARLMFRMTPQLLRRLRLRARKLGRTPSEHVRELVKQDVDAS